MHGLRKFLPLVLLVSLGLPMVVAGQEATWDLGLSRDFGYGAGGDIQGLFTMGVDDTDGLAQVDFLIDDEVVGTDREPPFEFQFSTGDYPLGPHTLSAVGMAQGGEEIRTPERLREFLSGEDRRKGARG